MEPVVRQCLAHGMSNKQIVERLVITPKTAANHVEHICAKIDVSSPGSCGDVRDPAQFASRRAD
jgi:DNA-binding NarL/FixJ family response regulator